MVGRLVTVATGVVLVGLGALFMVVGLAQADQLASTVGALAAVAGLGLSAWSVLARRVRATRDRAPTCGNSTQVNNSYGVQVDGQYQDNNFSTIIIDPNVTPSPEGKRTKK